MKEGWNVFLRYDEVFLGLNLYLIYQGADGRKKIVKPVDLTITENLPVGKVAEPTIRFHGNDAIQFLQELADGLVTAGFKPDELKASDRELQATKYHLEDMRTLVFETVEEITGPPIEVSVEKKKQS
jgi:hypothetical protein